MTIELRCPETGAQLTRMTLGQAQSIVGDVFCPRGGGRLAGVTEVMLRSDEALAYPVVDDHPVLLIPEALTPNGAGQRPDTSCELYAEVYQEMSYYTDLIERAHPTLGVDATNEALERAQAAAAAGHTNPPHPAELWLDRSTTVGANAVAYEHLSPLRGATVLQIGGRGTHVLKFLLAGAAEAALISPVISELSMARSAAEAMGLSHRLVTVCGIAEELPFGASFDRVYSGSSMHHTVTTASFPRIAAVMTNGARFVSVDVWRSPLYNVGIRLFGRATKGGRCRPLDEDRLRPAVSAFDRVEILRFGCVVRYPIAVLGRLGLLPPIGVLWRLDRVEERVVHYLPILGRLASLVVVSGTIDSVSPDWWSSRARVRA